MLMSMLACFLMIFVTVSDIFSRYVFKYSIPGVFELSETLMTLVVFLGLALAQQERAHLRAELFISRISRRFRSWFELFAHVLGLIFWGAITVMSFHNAWDSFLIGEYKEGLMKFPIWPVRWFLAFGVLLMCLQLVVDIQTVIRTHPHARVGHNEG